MARFNNTETASAAEVSRNFGDWQSRAMHTPVTITHHGRPRLMLLSVELFNEHAHDEFAGASEPGSSSIHAQLRAVLNQIHDGFIAFDKDLRVIDMNPAAESFIGVAKEEVIGRDLRDVQPQTQGSIAWDFYRRVLRTGESVEFRVKSTVRNQPPLKVQAFPYDDVGVGVLFTNLSAVEEVQVLKARDQAAKSALQAEADVGLLRLNARGVIEEVDARFCLISGFSAQQLSGIMLVELVAPKDRALVQRTLNAAIRDETPKAVSATILLRDGRERRLKLSLCIATHDVLAEDIIVWALDEGGAASMSQPG